MLELMGTRIATLALRATTVGLLLLVARISLVAIFVVPVNPIRTCLSKHNYQCSDCFWGHFFS